MSSEYSDSDRLSILINDAKDHGINILPPSVNTSKQFFYANDSGNIHYALSAIKNVGYKSASMIYKNRAKNDPYKTLFDLCSIDSKVVNKKVLENLIFSGACDCLEGNRAEKTKSVEVALKYGQKMTTEKNSSQSSLFGESSDISLGQPTLLEESEFENNIIIQNEKAAFGFYLSKSPLDDFKTDLIEFSNAGIQLNSKSYNLYKVGGIINDQKILFDRKNNQWAIITLECLHGRVEVFAFSHVYEKYKHILIDDAKIFVIGKPSNRGDNDPNQVKVVADKIFDLVNIRKTLSKAINIKIPYSYKDPKILNLIKDNASEFQGTFPVILYLENSDQRYDKIKLADIRMSSDIASIESLRNKLDKATVRIGI